MARKALVPRAALSALPVRPGASSQPEAVGAGRKEPGRVSEVRRAAAGPEMRSPRLGGLEQLPRPAAWAMELWEQPEEAEEVVAPPRAAGFPGARHGRARQWADGQDGRPPREGAPAERCPPPGAALQRPPCLWRTRPRVRALRPHRRATAILRLLSQPAPPAGVQLPPVLCHWIPRRDPQPAPAPAIPCRNAAAALLPRPRRWSWNASSFRQRPSREGGR
jgi:hypothetical protein